MECDDWDCGVVLVFGLRPGLVIAMVVCILLNVLILDGTAGSRHTRSGDGNRGRLRGSVGNTVKWNAMIGIVAWFWFLGCGQGW